MSMPAAILVPRDRPGSGHSSPDARSPRRQTRSPLSPMSAMLDRKAPLIGEGRVRRHSLGANHGRDSTRKDSKSSSHSGGKSPRVPVSKGERRYSTPDNEASSPRSRRRGGKDTRHNSDPSPRQLGQLFTSISNAQEPTSPTSPPLKCNMKRRPSFRDSGQIMPTLDEDKETSDSFE